MINLSLVIRLIRLKKKDPLNAEKQIDMLQDLVLAEMIEFVVPLVYVLVFCSAYFGPNSTLIEYKNKKKTFDKRMSPKLFQIGNIKINVFDIKLLAYF